jgi:AmmeMemoRadiSam system protein B
MSVIAAYMVPHPPMIVPNVGRGDEKRVELTTQSYERVAKEIAGLRPDTIVISSPHTIMYGDYFHISPGRRARGDFGRFRAPEVSFDIDYDTELVSRIEYLADSEDIAAGTLGERDASLDHGVMVPMYFINKYYTDYKLVRIGISGLPLSEHYRLGMIIAKASDETGRRVVYVASGDLSHKLQTYGPYGFAAEGPEYDKRIMDVCGRAAFNELFDFDENFCEKASECGHRSFVMMAGAFDGISVTPKFYSHEDVTGVGYGICSYYPQGADSNRKLLDIYLKRQTEKAEARKNSCDEYVTP